jgi:hypothetical protein
MAPCVRTRSVPDGEPNELRRQGLYRPCAPDGEQKAHATVDHRSVVNLSSNNYPV